MLASGKSESSLGMTNSYPKCREGRAILLDARIKALANKQERTFNEETSDVGFEMFLTQRKVQ